MQSWITLPVCPTKDFTVLRPSQQETWMMLFVEFVELLAKCILVMATRRTVVTIAG